MNNSQFHLVRILISCNIHSVANSDSEGILYFYILQMQNPYRGVSNI